MADQNPNPVPRRAALLGPSRPKPVESPADGTRHSSQISHQRVTASNLQLTSHAGLVHSRIVPREAATCPRCDGIGFVNSSQLEDDKEPESNDQTEEDPDPIEKALALAEEHLGETDPKKLSICVRCGRTVLNEENLPTFDTNGIPWYECPDGCEPPDDAKRSCVPMGHRMEESVLERTELNPDDALYQPPDDQPEEGIDDSSAGSPNDDTPDDH